MARDVIAILDHLNLQRVAVFGWSDGGMTGLNLAMNYTDRIDRLFVYGGQIHYNQTHFPGKDDPIVNSKSGTLESNFENGGVTPPSSDEGAEEQKRLRKRQEGGEEFWCESISPMPERCVDMYAGVLA
jgi:pimeloyl-ACP methyl ester carboxylesterase